MENKVLIRYSYRVGNINGTEEFNQSLKEDFIVQEIPKHLPAAGGNYEMWFSLFINAPLLAVIGEAIAGHFIYDLIKHFALKPFLDALRKLDENNKNQLEALNYKFYFDDITIEIHGVPRNYHLVFHEIYKEIFNRIPMIQAHSLTKDIYSITIPVDPNSGTIDTWEGSPDPKEYLKYWRIDTDFGINHFIYDFNANSLKQI